MSEIAAASDRAFAGSIPRIYDAYMVPMIFAPYAEDLARRVAADDPSAVLEIAAGTGAVTRVLAPRLRPNARYVVSDLNQSMLDHAAAMQGADARISWRTADALALPFEDASFDAVVCQFGVMFYPDRIKGYREARGVLKPGGKFIFNVWDRIAENEFAETITEALGAYFPENPPRFMARTPHGYFDEETIRDELRQAGFADLKIETRRETSRAASPRDAAFAYCQGTPLRGEIEAFGPDKLDPATEHAATAVARRFGNGAVTGRIQAHVITARR